MPAAFAVGPGYPLRFSEGRLGFVTRPLWMGQEDPVVCCGEGGISSVFSLSFRPGQFMTVGCGVAVSSAQILSFPLPAFLKKGGMVRAVSPWYLVAWKPFLLSVIISRTKIYVFYPYLTLIVVLVRSLGWLQVNLG